MDSADPSGRNYLNFGLCDNMHAFLSLRNPCDMHLDK